MKLNRNRKVIGQERAAENLSELDAGAVREWEKKQVTAVRVPSYSLILECAFYSGYDGQTALQRARWLKEGRPSPVRLSLFSASCGERKGGRLRYPHAAASLAVHRILLFRPHRTASRAPRRRHVRPSRRAGPTTPNATTNRARKEGGREGRARERASERGSRERAARSSASVRPSVRPRPSVLPHFGLANVAEYSR